jgi:hypothetical protein
MRSHWRFLWPICRENKQLNVYVSLGNQGSTHTLATEGQTNWQNAIREVNEIKPPSSVLAYPANCSVLYWKTFDLSSNRRRQSDSSISP